MSVIVSGNTFPIRHILKELNSGFKWNPRQRHWITQGNLTAEQIEKLAHYNDIYVDEHFNSGKVIEHFDNRSYKQKHGRCEDAPCCGCCGQYNDY